jgi:iron complex transport system ATP-binding protein
MLKPALRAQGIVAVRQQTPVLTGTDLCIMPGEFVSIAGSSGVGKSTLLHILAGLLRADFGCVSVQGTPIEQIEIRQRARLIAVALQSPALPGELTVLELVRLGRLPHERVAGLLRRIGTRDDTDAEPVERAIAAVGLCGLAQRPLGSLSGGQQRRAHIARVLAQQTPILLLDEPTTYLDQLTARQLLRELQRRAAQGTAIVLVTHDTAWVNRYCCRSLRLEHGSLLSVPQGQNQIALPRSEEDPALNRGRA